MAKLFLIPGLGADKRIYKNIKLNAAGYEKIYVDWLIPDLTDTLASYAEKPIKQHDIIAGSIVIGNSLGGMLAIEIAKRLNWIK